MQPITEPAPLDIGLSWCNRFSGLGSKFYTAVSPQPLPNPYWVAYSRSAAQELGLDDKWLSSPSGLQAFSGNHTLAGSLPLASVYSGHQFGAWAGQLGDGRACLLGEAKGAQAQQTLEIQLKGSGHTPYSRFGDGRAVLRSSIREFLASEAMHGLGIPTTRALCLVGSPLPVVRETVETAAVLTRTAPSFIRFGHFEHFAQGPDVAPLRQLADYVIDLFYPACRDQAQPYAALLAAVVERTATLLAHWQSVGFCHGVMNTDNMSMLGLTLDYGPFQFMDAYNPAHVCNHTDTLARYAFQQQPKVAYWNLFCLGQALMPLIGEQDAALAALEPYRPLFAAALLARYRSKLGLTDARPDDGLLIDDLLSLLAQDRVDYSIFWRRLCQFSVDAAGATAVRDLFLARDRFDAWAQRYAQRTQGGDPTQRQALMRRHNPRYVLRNHLGELAIRAALQMDFAPVHNLLLVLEKPFDEHPAFAHFADFAPDWAQHIEISCSS